MKMGRQKSIKGSRKVSRGGEGWRKQVKSFTGFGQQDEMGKRALEQS